MESIINTILSANPTTIIGIAAALVVAIQTGMFEKLMASALDRFSTRQVSLSQPEMLAQQIRLIRESSNTLGREAVALPKEDRNAILTELDEVKKTLANIEHVFQTSMAEGVTDQ